MMPVMLWTDMLLWGVVASVAVWVWRRLGSHTPSSMGAIFHSKRAMASGVILMLYLGLALADSVHFRLQTSSDTRIVSLMDLAMYHTKEATERTYSAPFATTEYSKSIVVDAKGTVTQHYLPLKHVATEASRMGGYVAFGLSFGGMLLFVLLHAWWLSKGRLQLLWQQLKKGTLRYPWHVAYATLMVVGTLLLWLYLMSFSYHVLGTDKVGEDIFYASLKSIRTGVLIGVLTTLVTLPLALLLGVSAGYFRGWVDDAIQYLYTTLSSIPGVLLIAAGVLSMQVMMQRHPEAFSTALERADMRLLFLILILGVTSWTGLCRMVRAETLRIAQLDYVKAAKAFGMGGWQMMLRHIIPNLSHIVLISIVLDFSGLVLAEAVLSYVGVGVDPTTYSWGNMINQARLEMAREPMVWWSLASAFAFMFVLVLSANLLADRVQEVLNPRSR